MSNMDMSEALRMLAADRGLTIDALLQVLVEALATAYKKRPNAADEVIVGVNPDNMDITFTAYDVDDDGNWINERDDTPKKDELGRIAAVTFRQVMGQRIREVERERKFEEYANREGDIVSGAVQKTDTRYTLLDLGRVEALLPQAEQVLGETREPNARLKAYIVEVRRTPKGPQIVVSRTHPGLIMRLFEMEVPEIADRIVEIKSCAREPGQRTKIAVWSNDKAIDPVGACVGMKGSRIHGIVRELKNENIDVINWTNNTQLLIQRSLTPAKITSIDLDEEKKHATVYLKPDQVSLAIGRRGVNIKLACDLTGYEIDVFRDSEGEVDEFDIDLVEFSDEIEEWVIEALKKVGCDTARSVLALTAAELERRTDLEKETIADVLRILNEEFEKE